VVLVTLSRDRGGGGRGARLFFESRLAAPDMEEGFRKEVLGLVGARLAPLLGEVDVSVGELAVEWRPALGYRKAVLRLTGGLPTVVVVGGMGEGKGGEAAPPATFDVLVKGVI
jgi:hypothetical protein